MGGEGQELSPLSQIFVGSEESLRILAVRNQDSIASVISKIKGFLDLAAVINPIRKRISEVTARKREN